MAHHQLPPQSAQLESAAAPQSADEPTPSHNSCYEQPVSLLPAPSPPRSTGTVPEGRAGDRWSDSARAAAAFLLGYHEATAAAYASDLRDFFAFAHLTGTAPLGFSRAQIELYARHLGQGRGLAPATVARRLATLSGYFALAAADELIPRNPMLGLRRPRVPERTQTLGLEREEVVALLRAAERHSPRAHALIGLLAFNGLRISEVLQLDVTDVGHRRGLDVLRVRRKGGKILDVPLAGPVVGALSVYLAGRRHGPLILSRGGRRLDRGSAGRLLRAVAAMCLPPEKADRLHPHALRHAWVAGLLDAGVPLHEVQRAASHASPVTTMAYDRARTEVSRDHPTFHLASWLAEAATRRPGA